MQQNGHTFESSLLVYSLSKIVCHFALQLPFLGFDRQAQILFIDK